MGNTDKEDLDPILQRNIFDLSISCTKEQAVMKILGWGIAEFYKKVVLVTEPGISNEEIIHAPPQEYSLTERLEALECNAIAALTSELEKPTDDGPDVEKIDSLFEKVEKVRSTASYAKSLLFDIEDELIKGDNSEIKIDHETTKKSGITHVNIRSVLRWHKNRSKADMVSEETVKKEVETTQTTPPAKERPKPKMRQQEEMIVQTIESLGYSPNNLPEQSAGSAGIKSKVREALKNDPLFTAKTAFDRAWERFRKEYCNNN